MTSGATQLPFRRSRTILTVLGFIVGLTGASAFAWWYFRTVKELDVATRDASELRNATVKKAAAPLIAANQTPRGPAVSGVPATPPAKPGRVTAPSTSEIDDLVVGISSARIGPIDPGDARSRFCSCCESRTARRSP